MWTSNFNLAWCMSPIHKQEHPELVKLCGEGCNWEDDGGGGGDVINHGKPDPGVPLADLHHLVHDLLLAADREPGVKAVRRSIKIMCVASKIYQYLRSKESVSALQRLIADSIALLHAL